MAFTNVWSESIPAGSAAPSTIDDQIRQLRLDIRERMNYLVNDWTVDPLVPTYGLRTGQTLIVWAHGAMAADDDDDISCVDTYVQSDDELDAYLFLDIPTQGNWKITAINVLANKYNAASVYIQAFRLNYSTSPSSTSIGSAELTESGVTDKPVLSGGSELTSGNGYMIRTVSSTAARHRLYATKITYDEV